MGQRGQGGDNFIDRLIRDANRQDAQGGQGGSAGFPSNVGAQQNLPNQQNAENLSGNDNSFFSKPILAF